MPILLGASVYATETVTIYDGFAVKIQLVRYSTPDRRRPFLCPTLWWPSPSSLCTRWTLTKTRCYLDSMVPAAIATATVPPTAATHPNHLAAWAAVHRVCTSHSLSMHSHMVQTIKPAKTPKGGSFVYLNLTPRASSILFSFKVRMFCSFFFLPFFSPF